VAKATTTLLMSLVEKSLLKQDSHTNRFQLHNALCQYAAEQLTPRALPELRFLHAKYYAQWLQQLEKNFEGSGLVESIRAMGVEHDNLHKAWFSALTDGHYELLTQSLLSLRTFYNVQSRFQEGYDWLEKSAEQLKEVGEQTGDLNDSVRKLLGQVLARQASFSAWLSHRSRAEALFAEALPILQHFADPAEIGFCLLNQGYMTVVSGNFDEAGAQFRGSLDHYRRAEDSQGIANALSALGAWHNVTGDWGQARKCLSESVTMLRQLNNEAGLRSALTNLGNCYYLEGEFAEAKLCYEEVLVYCQQVKDVSSEAIVLINLGTIAKENGDYETAKEMIEKGLVIFKEIDHQQSAVEAQINLGAVYLAMTKYEQAKNELSQALQRSIDNGFDYMIPMAVFEVACLCKAVGERKLALKLLFWSSSHASVHAEQRLKAEELMAKWGAKMPAFHHTNIQLESKSLNPAAIMQLIAERL
jgi:tetratricopeptide (TPR) repeat protein